MPYRMSNYNLMTVCIFMYTSLLRVRWCYDNHVCMLMPVQYSYLT